MEAGGPGSPNYHKSNALKTMRRRPELQGKLLAKGGWDYQLVDELQPLPGDVVLPKPRYSGFFNTQLDSILRSRGIRHLIFTASPPTFAWSPPCATASSWSISASLEDATHQAGPAWPSRLRCSILRPFWLGRRQLLRCAGPGRRALSPGGETLCLNRSLFRPAPPRRSPLLSPVRWPMAWFTSPVRCRLINTQRGLFP